MDPLTIIGYIISILVVAVPIAYTYSKKLGIALSIIYRLMNTVSTFMQGDLDHVWTDTEYATLGKSIVELTTEVHNNTSIDAVLNFKKE